MLNATAPSLPAKNHVGTGALTRPAVAPFATAGHSHIAY
jgi:hypothetical protein